MLDFFAKATKNSWDEDIFQLKTSGIITVIAAIVILIGFAILLRSKESKRNKFSTKQLVISALAMALALVSSYFKLFEFYMGGSITLFSMLFIVLIGYWYGAKAGIMTAVAYGLLQFLLDPKFYYPAQMLVDYPLAFGALGLSGIFSKKKNGLLLGYIVGVLGRYFFAFLSGLLFFSSYAADYNMSGVVYSLTYNGMYILPEAAITIILIAIPAMANALKEVKRFVLTE